MTPKWTIGTSSQVRQESDVLARGDVAIASGGASRRPEERLERTRRGADEPRRHRSGITHAPADSCRASAYRPVSPVDSSVPPGVPAGTVSAGTVM